MNKFGMTIAALLAALSLTACEREPDGPAERLGEAVDETAEELRESGENLADNLEDACEEFKDEVDARNEDC